MSTPEGLPAAGTPIRLRLCVLPVSAAGFLALVAAWSLGSPASVWSSAAGTAVVISFFSVTHVVLQRVLARAPHLAMAAAMLLYVSKVAVMLALVYVLRNVPVLDGKAFGLTVVAGTVVWTMSEVAANLRHRTLYVDETK